MNKKNLSFSFAALVMLLTLCSALPISKSEKPIISNEMQTINLTKINSSNLESSNISYPEIKEELTTLKGKKLSFKEKIALKLLHRKLERKFSKSSGSKSYMLTVILAFAFMVTGIAGLHRLYMGYTWQGIVQLLTFGGFGIWWLIDIIRLLTGNLLPNDGDFDSSL